MTLTEWFCCGNVWEGFRAYSGEIILATRLVLHVITIWSVLSYASQRRTKFLPTALACMIGGFSAAAIFQGIIEWRSLVFNTQPWVMGLTFCLAVICVRSRGNLAKTLWFIYPRKRNG